MFTDTLVRSLASGDTVRLVTVGCREAVCQARVAHSLDIGATRVLGEMMVAAVLMSAHIKGEERITLQVQSESPTFGLMAEIDAEGHVRGRIRPSELDYPEDGRMDGYLLAIKGNASREVYRGVSPIEHQTVAEALGAHLATSSQVDGVVQIHVEMTGDEVTGAWGLLLERLPYQEGQPTISPEDFAGLVKSLSDAHVAEHAIEAYAGQFLREPLTRLDERVVRWQCRCSAEKVTQMLGSLGREELLSIRAEQGVAEVTCDYCGTTYRHDADELLSLAEAVG